MLIGIENHLLGPLYTIPRTVWPYATIWGNFCTKCDGVGFLPFKGKNWTFFSKIENRPLHGSDRSSIIGDEKPKSKAYFQQLIMIPAKPAVRTAMPVLKQVPRKKYVTTTTDGRTKTPTPFMGAQFSFWAFFHTLDPDFFRPKAALFYVHWELSELVFVRPSVKKDLFSKWL